VPEEATIEACNRIEEFCKKYYRPWSWMF